MRVRRHDWQVDSGVRPLPRLQQRTDTRIYHAPGARLTLGRRERHFTRQIAQLAQALEYGSVAAPSQQRLTVIRERRVFFAKAEMGSVWALLTPVPEQ